MARLKLQLPDHLPFETEIPLRISDINYANHMGNDAVLSLVHEARMRFLSHHGYSEADIEGVGMVMIDAAIVYHAEAFYGQTLRIRVGVGEVSRSGFELFYRLLDAASGKPIASARTGMACFDFTTRKVRPLAETARRKFAAANCD